MKIFDITGLKVEIPSYATEQVNNYRLTQGVHKFDFITTGDSERPDFIIKSKSANQMSSGIPCPVCLEKSLEVFKGALHLDQFGHVLFPSTSAPQYGDGDVEILHWGLDGIVGTCYVCRGDPQNKPVW